MSQLNEDQRQRAEQNRLKALQIRQQKLAALASGTGSPNVSFQQTAAGISQSNVDPLKSIAPSFKSFSQAPSHIGSEKFYTSSNASTSAVSHTTVPKKGPGTFQSQTTFKPSPLSSGGAGPPLKQPKIDVGSSSPNKSSGLPSDVLKRIEENKRKAQERQEALRKARGEQSSIGKPASPILVNNIRFQQPVKPTNQPPQSISQPAKSTTQSTLSTTSGTKNTAQLSVSKPNRVVSVSFVLSSSSKFKANTSAYHQATIQVFKSIPSRSYDLKTQVWSFNLSDHRKLVDALRPLQPEVKVLPLPQFVLTALEIAGKKVPPDYIDLFGLDTRLLDTLMPFQVEGVKFGISLGGRVMLADDMGLGKTIQALGIACHYRTEWPLLVVTPSSMRYSWEESVLRWVSSVSGQDVRVITTGGDFYKEAQVVIVSYDQLSRRAETFIQHNFGVVILDESHMIKNHKSARYKATAPLMKKVRRVILLSGTPAMSRPMELYTQISGIDPSLFPNVHDYGTRYCDGRLEPWGWVFRGSSNTEELQIILQSCVWIRRLKSDVLSQLPPKQRMTVILDPGMVKTRKDFADLSRCLRQNSSSLMQENDHLQFFAKTAEAKIKAVREYLKEVLDSEKKFLVFGHHKVMLDSLCTLCQETKTKYIRIDGKTLPEERMASVTKFQSSDEVRVAVLSITAANTGITLTAAQLVIFAELYWNPGVLVQAEDRVHRIGQQDSVVVQYLVAKNTADDHIWPLIQTKLDVLSKVGLSDEMLDNAKTSYQKCAAASDIRKFMTSGSTKETEQKSPTKTSTTPDIRNFMRPEEYLDEADLDPNWNL